MSQDRAFRTTADGPMVEIDSPDHPRGTVRIAPAVLIQLIDLTVQGMDGIAELRSLRKADLKPTTAEGRTFDNGKIAVTVHGDVIDAAIAIAVTRGTNVTELTETVKHRIGFAAGDMLGMKVRSVDIFIDGITPPPAAS